MTEINSKFINILQNKKKFKKRNSFNLLLTVSNNFKKINKDYTIKPPIIKLCNSVFTIVTIIFKHDWSFICF